MNDVIDLDCLVSVVVPLSDDGEILDQFCAELSEVLSTRYMNYEVILVDDHSIDRTRDIITGILTRYDCIRYIRLSRRSGREIAISAGFESAIGDAVVVMHPEFDPPAQVPAIIDCARRSGCLVLGRSSRPLYQGLYRAFHNIYAFVCDRFLDIRLIPDTTSFMAMPRSVLNSMNQVKDKFRYVKSLSHQLGMRIELFDYEIISRRNRPWARSFFESLNLGIDLVVASSIRPLRYVSLLGLLVSGIYFLYFGYIALIAMFKSRVAEGWVTLSTQNALAFFVLNIVLATICEYLGRLLVESKDRPNYFVTEERNSSVMIMDETLRKNVVWSSVSNG